MSFKKLELAGHIRHEVEALVCASRAEQILDGACRSALHAPQVQRTKNYAPVQEVCRHQLHHHFELRLLLVRNRERGFIFFVKRRGNEVPA